MFFHSLLNTIRPPFKWIAELFTRDKADWGVKLSPHLYIVLSLNMSGNVPILLSAYMDRSKVYLFPFNRLRANVT